MSESVRSMFAFSMATILFTLSPAPDSRAHAADPDNAVTSASHNRTSAYDWIVRNEVAYLKGGSIPRPGARPSAPPTTGQRKRPGIGPDTACLVFDTVDGGPFTQGMSGNRFDGNGVAVTGHTNCGSQTNGFTGNIAGGTGGTINCSLPGFNYYNFGCSVPPAPTGQCVSETLTITGTDSNGNPMSSDPLPVSMCTHAVRELCRCGSPQNSAGRPIDLITGALWYRRVDAQLSGPLALKLSRFYDSSLKDSPSTYNSDSGPNWRINYDAYIQGNVQGQYALYHDPEGHIEEFWPLPLGGTARDNFSGDTLYLDILGSAYKLTTWKGATLYFSPAGWLTSVADRFGNQQTVTRDSNGHIQNVTDSDGRQLVFTHDGSTQRITHVTSVPAGVSVSFAYTGTNCPSGELCTATEPDGKTWSYQYDSSNELTAVVDGNGNPEENNTFVNGQVTKQTVGAGQQTMNFAYNPSQTVVTDGDVDQTTYSWDPAKLVVTDVSGALCNCGGGTRMIYHYDAYQRITEIRSGAQDTFFTYGRDVTVNGVVTPYLGPTQIITPLNDSSGQRTVTLTYFDPTGSQRDLVHTMTEPSVDTSGQNRVVTYTYDTAGRLQTKVISGYSAGVKQNHTVNYTVNTRGQVTQIVGPRTGVTTKFVYCPDSATFAGDQLEKIVDAAGNTTIYSASACPAAQFDPYGNPASIKDANGVVTNFVYDGAGRVLQNTIVNPSGPSPVTSYQYDGDGALSRETYPLGNAVEYAYDTSERLAAKILTGSTLAQRDELTYSYENMSRLALRSAASCLMPATTCPSSSWSVTQTESYIYDGFGNLYHATEPVPTGAFDAFAYDPNGLLNDYTDGNGHVTVQRTFQAQGIYTNNSETNIQFLHDTQGNLTQESENKLGAGMEPTNYKYDDFGRVVSATSEETGTATYTYDLGGNPTTQVQGVGSTAPITTTRTFDPLNRILTATSTKSGAPTETVTWTYDNPAAGAYGVGRLASVSDAVSGVSYAFSYEYRGLLANQTETASTAVYPLAFTYDGNGNRVSESLPGGQTLNFGYDYADRPKSVSTTSATFVSSATYAPFGPMTSLTFGNGTTECKTYDQRYRPTENKLVTGSLTPCQTPASVLADYVYGLDAATNITSIHDALNATYNRDFTYTGINLLQNPTSGSSLWGATGHIDYEDAGDINYAQVGSAANLSFSYDMTNTTSWLKGVQDFNSGLAYTVSHDALGNQSQVSSSAGTYNYTYSARDLLVSGDGVSYAYDGFGRRVQAQASTGTRWSFYDPAGHLIAESRLNQTGPSGIGYTYVWFAGRPVGQLDDSGTHWTFVDHLGAPLAQTNGTGSITWRAEYAPFGYVLAMRGQNYHQPLRLPGMEAEQLSGDTTNSANPNGDTPRYYGGHRWYQYQWERYTQPDPLGLAAGDNLYRYADDNPIGEQDPSGLDTQAIVDAVYHGTGDFFARAAIATNAWIAGFDAAVTHGYVGQWCAPATTVSSEDLENFALFAASTGLAVFDPEILALDSGEAAGASAVASEVAPGASEIGEGESTASLSASEGVSTGPTLFRGVASDSPGFGNALNGIANPIGGSASMLEHTLGNTASNFTSWTSDYEVALKFATNNGETNGVILTNTFFPGAAVPIAPNIEEIMGESEYLVTGPTSGATVTGVPLQ